MKYNIRRLTRPIRNIDRKANGTLPEINEKVTAVFAVYSSYPFNRLTMSNMSFPTDRFDIRLNFISNFTHSALRV